MFITVCSALTINFYDHSTSHIFNTGLVEFVWVVLNLINCISIFIFFCAFLGIEGWRRGACPMDRLPLLSCQD